MRRRQVWFLAIALIIFLAAFTGRNRTAADDRPDQSIDFRLNQIMVKLGQIEWELSQVKNRLGSQDRRLTDIDRKLDRILEEIEDAASTASTASMESSESAESSASASSTASTESSASASSRTAIDPALLGTWRLARNDFAEEIPNNIRRYLAEQAERAESPRRQAGRADQIDKNVKKIVDDFEVILDQAGFRLIRFRPDGMYTDGTGDEGTWLVFDDRLILTTFDGRAYPGTYSVSGAELTLTITGDQIGTLFRLERERLGAGGRRMITSTFKYTDRVRLFYTKDF